MRRFVNITLCLTLVTVTSTKETKLRYYPRYHFAAPSGLISNFKGIIFDDNKYFLFYEYMPNNFLKPGVLGFAKSPNLISWKHLPVINQFYDSFEQFSGFALINDDNEFLYYTCNENYHGEAPHHSQDICLIKRKYGNRRKMEYKNALMPTRNSLSVKLLQNFIYPNVQKNSEFINKQNKPLRNLIYRKVWEYNYKYYFVSSKRFELDDSFDQIVLYESSDNISWQQVSVLYDTDKCLSCKWEYPDFFELNGKYVLLFSTTGKRSQEIEDSTFYQTGYLVGDFNYETYIFKPMTEYRILDHGHDFYATQTIIDASKQRTIVAWFNMWTENAEYPEVADGFAGVMTIPRTLHLSIDNQLNQKPVDAVAVTRRVFLRQGWAKSRVIVMLEDKVGEINIEALEFSNLKVFIGSSNSRVILTYRETDGTVTLDRDGYDGVRSTTWRPQYPASLYRWTIYVDASSVELFCGEGEVTFSSRFFPDSPILVQIDHNSSQFQSNITSLSRTVPEMPTKFTDLENML